MSNHHPCPVIGWDGQDGSAMVDAKGGQGGRRAVFLDRDGTVIVLEDYLSDPDAVALIPGAAEAIGNLNRLGLVVVLVTNQSAISRGYFTEEVLAAVHERLGRLLDEEGAHIDAIYYCPHHPEEGCDCRKPGPGLLYRASDELGIDLGASFMVGDRLADVKTGKGAGCDGILVLTGYGSGEVALRDQWDVIPDHIADDLLGAVEWIEKRVRGG